MFKTVIFEDLVGQIDARQRGGRVLLRHVLDVAAEDGRLDAPGVEHVLRHEQELLVLRPPVLGDDRGEFLDVPHGGDVRQQQVQHRHEVRLARPEAPVQVARCCSSPRPPTGRSRGRRRSSRPVAG